MVGNDELLNYTHLEKLKALHETQAVPPNSPRWSPRIKQHQGC